MLVLERKIEQSSKKNTMNTEAATQPLEDLQETLDNINHLKEQIEDTDVWIKVYADEINADADNSDACYLDSLRAFLMETQGDLATFKKQLQKELSALAHLSGQVQRLLSPVEGVNGEYKAVVLCSPTK